MEKPESGDLKLYESYLGEKVMDNNEFAVKVTSLDWSSFHNQRRELIVRYANDPSNDLHGLICFLEAFQKLSVEKLGKEVVFPGLEEIFDVDREFCTKMLRERGYIYCPHCLGDEFDTLGQEDGKEHVYRCLMCIHCASEFAIRYENPTFVTTDELSKDIVKILKNDGTRIVNEPKNATPQQ